MKTERGVSLFSHNSSEPCSENTLAQVQGLAPIFGNHISVSALPSSPVRLPPLIKHIANVIRNSKVADPVISPFSVDVINFRGRVDAIVQEPRQPVSQITLAASSDCDVSVMIKGASGITNSYSGSIDRPCNNSGVGAIIKAFFNGFWDDCKIHFKLPLDLVRGRAVVAVRYPYYTPLAGMC